MTRRAGRPPDSRRRRRRYKEPSIEISELVIDARDFYSWQSTSPAQIDDATRQLSHDIFKQLIEINTTDSVGNVTTAAEAMAQRFRDAGFPDSDMQILGPNDRKKNLVVRLHGSGKHKPVLLIGHLDVVEARREDWTTDPFQFVEKDGYYYGRGTQDMKDGDAVMVTTLIRFKKEGFVPDRDIILALTADEEGGTSNGVDWLIKNHRELIDAEFVLNHDGGGILSEQGKPQFMTVDASEKLYSDYQLTVTNPGGHSSLPKPDNAIYHLADGLARLEHYQFPFELTNITRAYYERMAKISTGERAADMRAILKTPPDMARRGASVERPDRQLDHAHYLRGHASERGPCQQCLAANGASQCELPHHSRPCAGGDPAGTGEGRGRSQDFSEGHGSDRRSQQPPLLRAAAAASGRLRTAGESGEPHVAGTARGSRHGHRRLGRGLHQRRRHADVLRFGRSHRSR